MIEDDDFMPRKLPLAVIMAQEVIDMHLQLQEQEAELRELRKYKQEYHDLLNSSIRHSQHMIAGVMKLAMTPGVLPAIAKHNAEKGEGDVKIP
jgi:hypothetical protein